MLSMSSNFILGIVFLALASSGAIFRKTYFEVPLNEIKKRKNLGDDNFKQLDKALVYGKALRTLLWLYLGLTTAASLTLLAMSLPVWFSIILLALIIYWLFSILPSTRVTGWDKQLTRLANPGFIWILKYTSSYLENVSNLVAKNYKSPKAIVFDDDDLMTLIKAQSRQLNNRIDSETLLSLERAMTFNKHKIKDIMTPAKRVKTLVEDDIIGPILINDIHESGQDFALVKTSSKGNLSGVLALKSLNIKSKGRVADLMDLDIYYLNENSSINVAIKAIYETRQNHFVVINENKKFVGVITIETILKELTGPLSSVKTQSYNDADKIANLYSTVSENQIVDLNE
jgi:CBS domain containing-hemolysin-like protein